MIYVIVELSKYVILTLMVIYTFHCFYLVKQQSEEERNESLRQQLMLIFFMDFTAFLVIYLKTGKFQVVLFYIEMMAFFAGIQILYRIFYKKASILLLNNMCMLLSVGFIMLCRLDVSTATRQLVIVAGVNVVALIPHAPPLGRKRRGIARTCPDQEDELSQRPDMGLCGNRNRFAGGGICACKDKLWSKTFPDGNPAFRGDKDYICVLYGGIAEKRC